MVFKGLICRWFFGGKLSLLITLIMRFQILKGRDKIPLMISWSCMLFSFGFQEIIVMPPSRYRVIIPVET